MYVNIHCIAQVITATVPLYTPVLYNCSCLQDNQSIHLNYLNRKTNAVSLLYRKYGMLCGEILYHRQVYRKNSVSNPTLSLLKYKLFVRNVFEYPCNIQVL